MVLEIFRPRGILEPYVELFTFYEEYAPGHRVERLLPEGVIEMIIDLTEIPKYIYSNTTLQPIQTCRTAWISGMRKSFISISVLPQSSMFVVRFRPGKARPLLQVPLHQMENLVVDAECILPDVRELRQRLLEASTPACKFAVMKAYLTRRLSLSREMHPAVSAGLYMIVGSPAGSTIGRVVKETGFSHKHFTALFKEHVGMTPKNLVRVLRFQKAVHAIERQCEVNWAHLAIDCGYYDQAHLINDFREFCGYTPTEYVKVKGDIVNYIPVQ